MSGTRPAIPDPHVSKVYAMVGRPLDPVNLNLIRQSDTPSSLRWTRVDCSIQEDVGDPNGDASAWRITATGVSTLDRIEQSIIATSTKGLSSLLTFRGTSASTQDKRIDIVLREEPAGFDVTPISGKIRSGPGSLDINPGVLSLTDLDTSFYTEVEIQWNISAVVGDEFILKLYPGGIVTPGSANGYTVTGYTVDGYDVLTGGGTGAIDVFRPHIQEIPTTGAYLTKYPHSTEEVNGPEGADGTIVTVFASDTGYAAEPSDAYPFKSALFPAGLSSPYTIDIDLFEQDDFNSNPSFNVGSATLHNPDQRFEDWMGYAWDGRDIEIWQGEPGQAFAEFKRIIRGTAEDVTWNHDEIEFQLRDGSHRLDKLAQERLFGGFDQCLRGTGAAEVFVADKTPQTWVLGDLSVECKVRMSTSPAVNSPMLVWHGGGTATETDNDAWRFFMNVSSGRVVLDWQHGAGVSEAAFTPVGAIPTEWFTDGKWHHLAATRNTTSNQVAFYLDGEKYVDIEGFSSSVLPTGGENGRLWCGSGFGGTTNQADFDIDEVRVWDVVRTDSEIRSNANNIIDPSLEGLRAYYRMDEGTGSITYDEVSNLPEGLSRYVSLRFDGTDDEASVADHADIQIGSTFTIEAWIYPGVFTSGNNYYFYKDQAYELHHRSSDNELVFSYWDTTGGAWVGNVISDATAGRYVAGSDWMHVAVRWQDSTNDLESFINGVPVLTAAESGTTAGNGSASSLFFGRAGATYYQNWVAEFRLWDTFRSDASILSDYQKTVLVPAPLAWYKFDENTGTTVANSGTGAAGDLSVTGAAWVDQDGILDGVSPATWIGTAEGHRALQGVEKPIGLGLLQHIPMILVDRLNNIYFVAEGPIEAVDNVYEGAVPLTPSSIGAGDDIYTHSFEDISVSAFHTYDGTFTNNTAAANSAVTNDGDLPLTGSTPAVGHGFYVGSGATFGGVDLWMHKPNSLSENSRWEWEYWNGTAWAELPSLRDSTEHLTVAVTHIAEIFVSEAPPTGTSDDRAGVKWAIPSDWQQTTVNSVSAYYVRALLVERPPVAAVTASAAWVIGGDYVVDLTHGLVKLHTAPSWKPTAMIRGHNLDGSTYVDTPHEIARRLAVFYGGHDETAIDEASFTAMGDQPPIGLYIAGKKNLFEAMGDAMRSIHGAVFLNRDDDLTVVQIGVPEDLSPTSEVNSLHYEEDSLDREMTPVPSWRQRVTYATYHDKFSLSEINQAWIQDSDTVADLQEEFRYEKDEKEFNKRNHLTSKPTTTETGLDQQDDARAEAITRLRMQGVRRDRYRFTLPMSTDLDYKPGNDFLFNPGRFLVGSVGKPVIVMGLTEDPEGEEVEVRVWG